MTVLSAGIPGRPPLLPDALDALAAKYPNIPGHEITAAYRWFQGWDAVLRASPAPQDMRKKLVSYRKAIRDFEKKTAAFRQSGLHELVRRSCPPDGDRDAFEKIEHAALEALFVSEICIPRALAAIKDGRRPTAEQMLAANLATIAGRAGYPADATPNGAVTQILSALLTSAGMAHSDPRKIVKAALEKSISSRADNSRET